MGTVAANPTGAGHSGDATHSNAESCASSDFNVDGPIQDAVGHSGELSCYTGSGYAGLQNNIESSLDGLSGFGLSVGDGFMTSASDAIDADETASYAYGVAQG